MSQNYTALNLKVFFCLSEPEFLAWTEWKACSVTCGIGTKKRSRDCVDINHNNAILQIEQCLMLLVGEEYLAMLKVKDDTSENVLNQFVLQTDKCDMGGCAGIF